MKKALLAIIAAVSIMGCTKDKVTRSEIEIKDGRMSPEAMLSLGRLSDPQLSPDSSRIIYGVKYASVSDNSFTKGLFICNADGSKRQYIRGSKGAGNARWSLDGKSLYFLQDGQMCKAEIRGCRLVHKEKISDVPAGISEFKLSPDQQLVLYISTIKNPDMESPADVGLDKAQAYTTEKLMYRHWDHWVTEIPRTFVSTMNNGTINAESSFDILGEARYELPTEPFGGAEQLSWSPDGRYIAYSCRKVDRTEYAFSTDTEIYIYNILLGAEIRIPMEGGYDTDPVWSPDGSKLAWISMERNGYEADRQRIMIADLSHREETDGQCFGLEIDGIREITTGYDYDASGLVWTDNSEALVFASTIDGLGALCRVNAVGDPAIKRLTPAGWWFNFDAPFQIMESAEGLTLLTSYMSMAFPTELVRIDLGADGQASYTPITHENEDILSRISPMEMTREIIKTAQGEDLYCWVLYPPHFDKEKVWPGIEMFNGGPQTCLDQGWSYRWNFALMAQQGYVVILPNRHGDSGFGQAWKEQISGDYQGLNMEDYKIAARWFKEKKWAGKLAGVGASYGGFSVYNMMGIHGDLFDCFVSHAGIFDEKSMWYTTEEMWFPNWDNGGLGEGESWGGIQQGGAPYSQLAKARFHYANDPESRVTDWHTPLLCMHGMLDFRIPYEQGMAAFNAAQMMGVPSKLVMFPEECHWVLQPQNALYWQRNFFDWTDKWTKQ